MSADYDSDILSKKEKENVKNIEFAMEYPDSNPINDITDNINYISQFGEIIKKFKNGEGFSTDHIYKEVIKYGIDCLLIEKGHIDLFELNYGFIGGCSFLISNNELAFLGNIKNHTDYDKILDFIQSKNKKLVSLSDDKLLDLGSVIPLLEY